MPGAESRSGRRQATAGREVRTSSFLRLLARTSLSLRTSRKSEPLATSYAICVVTQQYHSVISGIGLHARNLVAQLIADGHRVVLLAPKDQRPDQDGGLEFAGVAPARLAGSQARWLSLAWSFSRALPALEREHRFDLVHFTDARESLFCRPDCLSVGNVNDTYAAEVAGPGYYRDHYSDWLFRWPYYRAVKLAEAVALPRLSAVIANSRYTAGVIAKQYRLRADRLRVCYKAVDPGRFVPALLARAKLAPHAPRVLFVGGNMQRKGLPVLIRAAGEVRARLPGTEFWVVGQDKAAQHMKDLCRSCGVEAAFRFFGLRSQGELLDFYAQADAFVMPSLVEAFGVVFLEAMAAGVPVIGTRAGGIPELIEHGRNGLLAEPEDSAGLADLLCRVLADASLQHRLRENGLRTAREFTPERMMQCTYGVYRDVIGSSRLRSAE